MAILTKVKRRFNKVLKQFMAQRAAAGPYRFLVKRWDQFDDIDLAARVLSTDYFRYNLEPLPLPLDKAKRILVLAPHFDDESIGAGGTLLLAKKANIVVHILFTTDGLSLTAPFANSIEEQKSIREAEAKAVCKRLGATMQILPISNRNPTPTIADLDSLYDVIQRVKPDVIMLPWLLDYPPKHRMLNHLLWLANKNRELPNIEAWTYQVHNNLYPNTYVDITSVINEKMELLNIYRSQLDHLCRYDHVSRGMTAWNSRLVPQNDGFDQPPRHLEVFFSLPLQELLRLVDQFYFSNLDLTYRGSTNIIRGMKELHRNVMNENTAPARNSPK